MQFSEIHCHNYGDLTLDMILQPQAELWHGNFQSP